MLGTGTDTDRLGSAEESSNVQNALLDPLFFIPHNIEKTIHAKGVKTKVGTGGEEIDNFAVLKRGDKSKNWGWDHIKDKHGDQYKDIFGTTDDNDIINLIDDSCNKPDSGYSRTIRNNEGKITEYRFAKNYGDSSNPKWVYVSSNGDGSITTAIPTKDTSYVNSKF